MKAMFNVGRRVLSALGVALVLGWTGVRAADVPGVWYGALAWGDYNGDGLPDLAVTGATNQSPADGISQIWRNLGSGDFADSGAVLPSLSHSAAAWADYDLDGRQDLVMNGWDRAGKRVTELWRNTTTGFVKVEAGLPATFWGALAWGDYDNDGRPDLVLTGWSTNFTRVAQIWRNTAAGFVDIQAGLPGVDSSAVAWGDYNGDGRLDLALSGTSDAGDITQIWRNTGSGFVHSGVVLPSTSQGALAWGDYNNDGRQDLLVVGNADVERMTQIWRNTGTGFVNSGVVLPGLQYASAAWGDYDRDGWLDLLLTGDGSTGRLSQVWRNNGGGFVNANFPLEPIYWGSAGWVDLNFDGWLDLALAGDGAAGRVFQLWQNTPADSAPFAVTGNAGVPAAKTVSVFGTINPLGANTFYYFEFGPTPSYGSRSITNQIAGGNNPVGVATYLTGLAPGTGYHYRLVAYNAGGSFIGSDREFATITSAPGATTLAEGTVTSANAVLNGSVMGGGLESDYYFEYGLTTSYGSRTATNRLAASGFETPVTATISGLSPVKTYYYRLVAINSLGTATGGSESFATKAAAPSATTLAAASITTSGAALKGSINPNGAATSYFFEYGKTASFGSKSSTASLAASTSSSSVSLSVSGLSPGTLYHYRAVASNSVGVVTGATMTLTTTATSPTVTTLAASGIVANAAVLNGTVNPNGAATSYYFEYGLTTSYGTRTPTNVLAATSSVFSVSAPIGGLTAAKKYYYRLVANNSVGNKTATGLEFTTTTSAAAPVAVTLAASGVTTNGAVLNGTVNPNGAATSYYFEHGATMAYGSRTGTNSVAVGTNAVAVSATLSGLGAGTTQHYRLIAVNVGGTSQGGNQSVTTTEAPQAPVVVTLAASGVTTNSATLNGTVNPNGAATGYYFEYGPTAAFGSKSPVNALAASTSAVAVSASVGNLASGSTWHFRLVATNAAGLANGTTTTFATDAIVDPAFQLVSTGIPAVALGAAAWADYDGDDRLDLLVSGTNASGSSTRLWRNTPTGFVSVAVPFPAVQYGAVAWGDADNDGRPDLLFTGEAVTGAVSQVWRNTGAGFQTMDVALPGVSRGAVAWSDFDQDGRQDFVLTGLSASGPVAQVWRNTGTGFSRVATAMPGVNFSAVAWLDYDRDGLPDLALAGLGASNRVAQLWRNTGTGFASSGIVFPAISSAGVLAGDYDNDGWPDLLFAGRNDSGSDIVGLWRNTGGAFTAITAGFEGIFGTELSWADVDGNGRLDLPLAGYASGSGARFWRNGTSGFESVPVPFASARRASVPVADYDNDGRPDVAVFGGETVSVAVGQLWKNVGMVANTAPTVPVTLPANTTATSATLSWEAATDVESPAAALTYNLRVGTTPGGGDIVSAVANPATGFRRIVAPGNQQSRRERILELPPGTYYWAVQSIDNGLRASAFSPEQSFVVSAAPVLPTAVTLAASGVGSREAVLQGRINPNGAAASVYFEFGPTSAYGWTTSTNVVPAGNLEVAINGPVGGLLPGGVYHYRLVAVNEAGIVRGEDVEFTADVALPVVASAVAESLTASGAVIGGTVNPGGGATSYYFEHGPTTDYGWTTQTNVLQAGHANVTVSATLAGLVPGVDHHYRLVAVNAAGQAVSGDQLFSTLAAAPTVVSTPASGISAYGATANGTIHPNGAATGYFFEYGPTAAYGMKTATNVVSAGSGTTAVNAVLGGLKPGTNYHYRLVGLNAAGSSQGANVSFKTSDEEAPAFAAINGAFPAVTYASAAWGDYDNDGRLDLALIGNRTAGRVAQIWRNTGSGFVNIGAPITAVWWGSVAWGDYDNDGRLDLLVTGEAASGPVAEIWRNTGSGFVDIKAGLPGVLRSAGVWGDYDADGRLDLAIMGTTTNSTICQVWRNTGTGFVKLSTTFPGGSYAALAWADIDNDGDLDLTLAGFSTTRFTQVWRNDAGVFRNTFAALPGVSSGAVAWFDQDNDGDLDLILNGHNGTNTLTQLWRNQGGTLSRVNVAMPGIIGQSLDASDFDGDGRADLVFSGADSAVTTTFWRNSAAGFVQSTVGIPVLRRSALVWGDYDNDGRSDLFVAGGEATGIQTGYAAVWRATAGPINAAPAVPSGLAATVDGAKVTLRWTAPGDDRTPSQALSYALRLGTSPGGSEILASQADAATGFRRLPGLGNLQLGTVATFTLPAGTYYWSVQAVDSGSMGSIFPTEQSFVVGGNVLAETGWSSGEGSVATLSGSVYPNGTPARWFFEYGLTTSYGLRSTTNLIAGGFDRQVVSNAVSILAAGMEHHFRIVVMTDQGTVVGQDKTFTPEAFQWIEPVPGLAGGATAWGDMDNDGRVDLLVAGTGGPGAGSGVWRNGGVGFVHEGTLLPDLRRGAVAWGDVDNDGLLDFAMAGDTGSNFIAEVWRNTGAEFEPMDSGLPGLAGGSLAWGDFDRDGRLDLLVTGETDGGTDAFVTELWRNGAAGFERVPTQLPPVMGGAAVWGDYDNDGRLDVLVTGSINGLQGGGVVRLFRNTGAGFAETTASFPGLSSSRAAWGDYDNDGRLDLVATGIPTEGDGGPVCLLWRGTPEGFEPVAADFQGVANGSVAWGDYDNDGRPDLFVVGEGAHGEVADIWHNGPDGFVRIDVGLAGSGSRFGTFADVDNDGRLDLMFGGATFAPETAEASLADPQQPAAEVLRSVVAQTNEAPTAPSGLVATTTPLGAALGWAFGTDAETPAESLTYSLRVGTTPGGSEIVAPGAAADGTRRLQAMGNHQLATNAFLVLPPGTYYWSVQSVDAGYVGSVFAPEQTFTIAAAPVVVPALTGIQRLENGSIRLTFSGAAGAGLKVVAGADVSSPVTLWTELGLATETSPGVFEFVDTAAAGEAMRFYGAKTE